VTGHRYLVAGAVDTRTGKAGFWDPVYLRDDGVGTMPASPKLPLSTILNATCDAGQSQITSDDLLGGFVTADSVVVTGHGGRGDDFLVTGPYGSNADTLRVANDDSSASFTPVVGQLLRVTGALHSIFGNRVEIQPRDSTDIVVLGMVTGVVAEVWDRGPTLSVHPTPSASGFVVDFAVPRAGLAEIEIYDVQGRPVKALVKARVPAGSRTIQWDGSGASGSKVASGIYFARLRTEGVTRTARIVLLR